MKFQKLPILFAFAWVVQTAFVSHSAAFEIGQVVLATYENSPRKAKIDDIANGMIRTDAADVYLDPAKVTAYQPWQSIRMPSGEIFRVGQVVLATYGDTKRKATIIDIANGNIKTDLSDIYLPPEHIESIR